MTGTADVPGGNNAEIRPERISQNSSIDRYLRLLGIRDFPVGLEGLRQLVRAHLVRVPFENVSKLLLFAREGAGRPITLTQFLDGIEHEDLGGTCYSSNPFLAELLAALGYECTLLGADMSTPDVHTSIRVRIDGHDYHVDVGYAGPFAEPLALDRVPQEIPFGTSRYVFNEAPGGHEMVIYAGGERHHGYLVHPPARPTSYFHPTIVRSFDAGRTFMRCLRITKFLDATHAVELRNRKLLHLSADNVSERIIDSMEDLRQAINEEFLMPRCPIEQAVETLERLNGQAFFGPQRWLDSTEEPE